MRKSRLCCRPWRRFQRPSLFITRAGLEASARKRGNTQNPETAPGSCSLRGLPGLLSVRASGVFRKEADEAADFLRNAEVMYGEGSSHVLPACPMICCTNAFSRRLPRSSLGQKPPCSLMLAQVNRPPNPALTGSGSIFQGWVRFFRIRRRSLSV